MKQPSEYVSPALVGMMAAAILTVITGALYLPTWGEVFLVFAGLWLAGFFTFASIM